MIMIESWPCPFSPAEAARCLKTYAASQSLSGFAFLDSGERMPQPGKAPDGRFSLIALDPWLDIRCQDSQVIVNGLTVAVDLFTVIRDFLRQHAQDLPEHPLPEDVPFTGGLIGYFAYDLAATLDPAHMSLPPATDHSQPLAWLVAYDQMILIDTREQMAYLMAWGQRQDAKQTLVSLRMCLENLNTSQEPVPESPPTDLGEPFQVKSNFTRDQYLRQIAAVREAIGEGEVYILNLAQRLNLPPLSAPFDTYLKLRQNSPTPYAAYLELPDLRILSFSPELFLKVNQRTVITRPIKGTRPRNSNPLIDVQNRQELLASAKDRAELLMIVDLERNDLSRVCTADSVKVDDLFKLETYATVYHLVATVSGQLCEDQDAVSCFQSLFPGGSITGAPKLRAMQLISSFETVRRGLYTGCLGYFSLDGQAAFNILIRTIIDSDQATTYHAGGGITWDSDPTAEYQETLDKTQAIAEVLSC